MTERQRRIMMSEGKRPDKIIQLAGKYLDDLKKEDATLGEAKEIVKRMAYILEVSERYRPEALLSDIPFRI